MTNEEVQPTPQPVDYVHALTGPEVLAMVQVACAAMAAKYRAEHGLELLKAAANRTQLYALEWGAGQFEAFKDAVATFPLEEPRTAEDGIVPFADLSADEREAVVHAAGYSEGWKTRDDQFAEFLADEKIVVVEPGSDSDPFAVGTPAWDASVLDEGQENAPSTPEELEALAPHYLAAGLPEMLESEPIVPDPEPEDDIGTVSENPDIQAVDPAEPVE